MKKILALVGDFYHPADYLSRGLSNIFTEHQEYSLEVKEDYQEIYWDKIMAYDLFILAASGKLNPEESDDVWMTEEHQEILHNYVSEGGSLMVLHSGLAGYPTDGLFRQISRGHFIEHPPEHPAIMIRATANDHYISEGIEEFTIVDEQYFVEVDEKDTIVVLKAESEEFGVSIAGWAHSYKAGRVSCITPGHTLEVLNQQMMKKVIIGSVEWCLA
ncbi:MAG: ThuA domain-containing protein [Halanaerobiales bacterium]